MTTNFFKHTHTPDCRIETDDIIAALHASGALTLIPDPEKRLQEMEVAMEELEIRLTESDD